MPDSTHALEAVILAGGKGTRLYPYTSDLPKPLVPVGGRPVIEILLRRLQRNGVTRVRIAVNHLSELIENVLGTGEKFGLRIDYVAEGTPLSTIGPLSLISDLPENFIVANGDIITDLDVRLLMDAHRASDAVVTVATHRRTERIDFGVIHADERGRVIGFEEKPTHDVAVSMGLYAMSRTVLQVIPAGIPFGFDELMLKLLRDEAPVQIYPYRGYWLDVGRPDDLERANREIERLGDI